MRKNLKEKILALVKEEGKEIGDERCAMRDLLTDCIHICEEQSWSFARTMAGAIEVFKEEQDAQRGSYVQAMDHCPLCGSDNICNEDAPDDAGNLEVTCHNCSYQWIEPADLS